MIVGYLSVIQQYVPPEERVELETPGTKSKLVELKKTYASSVRNQNNRVEVDLAECEEVYPSTH